MKGLIELERRCQTLKERVEHLSEEQEVLADLMVSKKDMQKEASREYLRGIQGAGGAKSKRSFSVRTKEAQADQVGR